MKNLIYFTIGADPNYINLTYWCIHSLLYNDLDLTNVDILIMCDEDYLQYVKATLPTWIKIMITDKNSSGMMASMRKLEIFNYEHISKYNNILYLDSDIVVVENISNLFEKELNPDLLYVKYEESTDGHTHYFHSLCLYTDEQLIDLEKNNIKPFSCGHFMFKNTSLMREHFNNILCFIKIYKGPFFYEQSFMNHYFNSKKLTDIEYLETYIDFYKSNSKVFTECVKNTNAKIYHVCNSQMKTDLKLINMKFIFCYKQCHKDCLLVDTRDTIATFITLPPNPHIVELGVFKGEFAEILLKTYNPYMLYLIDSYEGDTIDSGDKNGNNIMRYKPEELKPQMLAKFEKNNNVLFLHSRSTILDTFEDDSMDMVYIDTDHTAEGVKIDLNIAYKKVKSGGWICGHDYDINPQKCNYSYDFGVKKEVSLFCADKLLRIDILFNDGCLSYAIKVFKIK